MSTGASFPNSYTGNVRLSTVPAGAAPAATLTGLNANTTYYPYVDARNWNDASSGYRALGSTSTLAFLPTTTALPAAAPGAGATGTAGVSGAACGGTTRGASGRTGCAAAPAGESLPAMRSSAITRRVELSSVACRTSRKIARV